MKTFRSLALGAGLFLGGFLFSLVGSAQAAPLTGLNADLDGMLLATGTVTTVQTTVANNATTSDTPLATGTISSAYFGMNYEFKQLTFNIGQAGTDGVVTWEYCSAQSVTCTTWTALSGVTDGTDSFKTSGTNNVTYTVPGDWVTSTIFDGTARYYARARMTTGYAVHPLATQISALEFNLKLRVSDELGSAVTGLAQGAFTITNCTDTTNYAFREIGTGLYELGLLTQGADTTCDYTATSSGFVATTAATTGALSTASVTGTAATLSYAVKVTVTTDGTVVLSGAAVVAGDSLSVSCTESGSTGIYYCAVPVSHTGVISQVTKSGYSGTGTYTDRTAESDAQSTLSITAGATGGGGGSVILGVSKDATPTKVHAGSNVIYTVTLSNTGSMAAENVVVIDMLPTGFAFSDGTQTKTVSTVALFIPGPTRVIAYVATVGSSVAPGIYWNNVIVTNGSSGAKLYAQVSIEVLPGGVQPETPTPSPSPSSSPTVTQLPQPYGEKAAVPLYRIEGDPRVYAVVNNTRRHIPNPEAFSANGFAWGAIRVFSAGEAPQYKESILLRAKGDPKVYVIRGSVKTWIKTADEFAKGGYKWEDVVEVPGVELTSYATSGASGVAAEGAVAVLKPSVLALNVRSAPALTGTRIGRVTSGQTVTVLATQGVWFKVRLSSGLEGWSHGAYLQE